MAAIVAGVAYFLTRGSEALVSGTTAPVVRGALVINVVEDGTIDSLQSQDIKSEVKRQTKIIDVVEEGYQVTEEDVRNGKVLVQLDANELSEELTAQEIQYQGARSAYLEAQAQYEIQKKQNESDIREAELAAKFARMDLEKYVGSELAQDLIARYVVTAAPTPAPAVSSDDETAPPRAAAASDSTTAATLVVEKPRPHVDFSNLVGSGALGGEATQKMQDLEAKVYLAQEELKSNEIRLAGTEKLFERQFVTQLDLDSDKLKVERGRIEVESAQRELDLFVAYEFPKQAEKLLSDYEEALRKLDRVIKQAESKLMQDETKLRSTEAQHNLQQMRRDELRQQVEKCVIVAERPGLVIYAGSDDPWRRQDPIEKGANIHYQMEILTIPDMTQMSAEVKVHEAVVKKIRKGQKARIRVVGSDEVLTGEVIKVNILPDSSQRWMNPDVKLYPVQVSIDGVHEWLRPSMSCDVEIEVARLDNVLYVPVQAVIEENGQRVCYVDTGLDTERRVVETGEMNIEHIEIKKGLKEGERVLLRAPDRVAGKEAPENGAEEEEAEPSEAAPEAVPGDEPGAA